ncbi:hypothetical protein D2M30_1923 [Bacillus amyloliquefaciens]|nr:hypothetical protein D2M30_1923 [Bacillus amyloliquefaciens]
MSPSFQASSQFCIFFSSRLILLQLLWLQKATLNGIMGHGLVINTTKIGNQKEQRT